MEEILSPDTEPSREEQIRALGYDPQFLTPDEQTEMLELHVLCPDEAIGV